jgi:hypothetical protein
VAPASFAVAASNPNARSKKYRRFTGRRWAPSAIQGIESVSKNPAGARTMENKSRNRAKNNGNNEKRGRDSTLGEVTESESRFLAAAKTRR